MEKAVGIICELNPLHQGHAYLLEQVKKAFPEKSIVCVMSGNFVQRGSFAIQEKYSRAKCALKAGANLVLELPFPFSSLSSESFGKSAVSILSDIGVCDTLAFGSEISDVKELELCAENLLSEDFETALKDYLLKNPGKGYPFARERVYTSLFGPSPVLSNPNASLALSYITAIRERKAALSPFAVERKGNIITSLDTTGAYLSATAIRNMIERGEDYSEKLPSFVSLSLEQEKAAGRFPVSMDTLSQTLFYLIKTKSRKELSSYYGFSALCDRAKKFVFQSESIEDLVSKMNSASFTDSRIRRGLLAVLCQIPRFVEKETPSYSMVLAADEKGRALLSQIKEKSDFPLFTKPAHALKSENKTVQRQFSGAAMADEIYAMAFPKRVEEGYFLKQTPTII